MKTTDLVSRCAALLRDPNHVMDGFKVKEATPFCSAVSRKAKGWMDLRVGDVMENGLHIIVKMGFARDSVAQCV